MDANSSLRFMYMLFKFFILIIAGFFIFLWISSIDENITTGEYYGFKIGFTKNETYKFLLASSGSMKLESRVELSNDELKRIKNPLIINSNFTNEEYHLFENKDEWDLFVESPFFFDSISLTFCDERLCKIWRRRDFLELP